MATWMENKNEVFTKCVKISKSVTKSLLYFLTITRFCIEIACVEIIGTRSNLYFCVTLFRHIIPFPGLQKTGAELLARLSFTDMTLKNYFFKIRYLCSFKFIVLLE